MLFGVSQFPNEKKERQNFKICKENGIRQLESGFCHKKIYKDYIDHEASRHRRRAAREAP